MYGQNLPQGFIPVRHENGSPWNNQLNSDYRIKNGYNYNIGIGELVYITTGAGTGGSNATTAGYLVSWAQLPNAGQLVTVAGVFQGCFYPQNNSFPITGPLGHLSWIGGTYTADGSDPVAYIITDPSVVYTAQCNGSTGFTSLTANQMFYNTYYQTGTMGTPPGGTLNNAGTQNAASSCCQGIDLALVSGTVSALSPIRTLCLDPALNNPLGPNNNAYCMIQNGMMFSGPVAGQHA